MQAADGPGTLDVLKETCRESVAALDAAAALFSRVIGDLLLELAEHTASGRTLHLGHEYLISDYPLTEEAIVNGESRTVSLLDDDADPKEAALLVELGFESLLMVPVFVKDECWGLLEVYGVDGRRFDTSDARRAEEIVARAATHLAGR